ncbi:MAG: hypothetical protein WDZ88_02505 [Candidatus Paceibacterota bacterium]
MLNAFFPYLENEIVQSLISGILAIAPYVLPFFFAFLLVELWIKYVRARYVAGVKTVLLEIRLPREISKSPRAMELVFISLYQGGSTSHLETWLEGKVRPWFSLELVSVDGQVHFYIWTHEKYRKLIESQIYAQYPNVEIVEAEDYTLNVYRNPKEFRDRQEANLINGDDSPPPIWATYFRLGKPDSYPIKTYVDYGLDKDPKEEFKIDPMSSVIEFLGSLKKGEQVWIQILIQAHRKEGRTDAHWKKEIPDWKKAAREEIDNIRKKATQKSTSQFGEFEMERLTPGQTDTIKAIERSIDKYPFEVMIRGMYIPVSEFDPISITGLIGSFRQYSSPDLNELKLGWFTDFDYPWQDFRRMRRSKGEWAMFDAYKRRSFFQAPYKNFNAKRYILNTEELATIFHLPGDVVQTPGVNRIPSKKSGPPTNLPI